MCLVCSVHWTRFTLAVIGSGIVTTMTDWFFAGDWIHTRWTYPEVWRKGPESRAIIVSSVFPFLTCAAFVILALWLGDHSFVSALKLAFLVWIIGPFPLILTNAAFMKLHWVFVVLYSTGWLMKLVIAAAAVHWLLA